MSWLSDVLYAPFANMHQHLHRLRMAMPPKEQPATFTVDDPRSRLPTGNLPPPKPPTMRQQRPEPTERRDSSPLRPPYGERDDE